MAPNKPASRKWNDVQLAIAAIAMTSVLAFWNMFAGPDREKALEKTAAQQALLIPATVTAQPIALPTVPPVGYTILFGGVAPQPQVIVQSTGGGGGNNGGGGSVPVTSTGSS